jgi:hypothetical protein
VHDSNIIVEERMSKKKLERIMKTRKLILKVARDLMERAIYHDESSLSEEENEKKVGLIEMYQHHWHCNRHHPEHYSDGVSAMTLVDVIEMLCDWVIEGHEKTNGLVCYNELDKRMHEYGINRDGILYSLIENTYCSHMTEVVKCNHI